MDEQKLDGNAAAGALGGGLLNPESVEELGEKIRARGCDASSRRWQSGPGGSRPR
jgi:hypothetical protein